MFGESLLGKFVDLLAQSAKERPRRASLKSLVRLRRSLLECQDSYERFSAISEQLGVDRHDWGGDERLYRLHERWVSATHSVLMDVSDLGEELEILSPDTVEALRFYRDREIDGVHLAARQMGVSVDGELDEYSQEVYEPVESGSFGAAISRLDEFIRTNFSPDELRAAL